MLSLTPQQILFIHYRLIESTGGAHGVRDIGALQAAAACPSATFDGEDLYPAPFAKAAALMESIIKNHPFVDGNKRTAITSHQPVVLNAFELKLSYNHLGIIQNGAYLLQ